MTFLPTAAITAAIALPNLVNAISPQALKDGAENGRVNVRKLMESAKPYGEDARHLKGLSDDATVQFSGCVTLSYDGEEALANLGDEDAIELAKDGGIVPVKSYVLFDVCPSGKCAVNPNRRKVSYMVDLTTYVEAVGYYVAQYHESYCDACSNYQDYCASSEHAYSYTSEADMSNPEWISCAKCKSMGCLEDKYSNQKGSWTGSGRNWHFNGWGSYHSNNNGNNGGLEISSCTQSDYGYFYIGMQCTADGLGLEPRVYYDEDCTLLGMNLGVNQVNGDSYTASSMAAALNTFLSYPTSCLDPQDMEFYHEGGDENQQEDQDYNNQGNYANQQNYQGYGNQGYNDNQGYNYNQENNNGNQAYNGNQGDNDNQGYNGNNSNQGNNGNQAYNQAYNQGNNGNQADGYYGTSNYDSNQGYNGNAYDQNNYGNNNGNRRRADQNDYQGNYQGNYNANAQEDYSYNNYGANAQEDYSYNNYGGGQGGYNYNAAQEEDYDYDEIDYEDAGDLAGFCYSLMFGGDGDFAAVRVNSCANNFNSGVEKTNSYGIPYQLTSNQLGDSSAVCSAVTSKLSSMNRNWNGDYSNYNRSNFGSSGKALALWLIVLSGLGYVGYMYYKDQQQAADDKETPLVEEGEADQAKAEQELPPIA